VLICAFRAHAHAHAPLLYSEYVHVHVLYAVRASVPWGPVLEGFGGKGPQ